jgi:hypothetical protein
MRAVVVMLMATMLVFASGCAKQDWIDRTLVTVDVTGTWSGSVRGEGAIGSRELLLDLEQQGSTVKGSVKVSPGGGTTQTIDGTIAGDVFRFRDSRGRLEGDLTVSGDEMAGRVSFLGSSSQISLQRLDRSSLPGSPPR